jgi:hypothetical protein
LLFFGLVERLFAETCFQIDRRERLNLLGHRVAAHRRALGVQQRRRALWPRDTLGQHRRIERLVQRDHHRHPLFACGAFGRGLLRLAPTAPERVADAEQRDTSHHGHDHAT